MEQLAKFLVIFIKLLTFVNSENLDVKISTDSHVNLVSDEFLSFTVDPKFLFSRNEKKKSMDCLCMASSLSPAYIRIAGSSTQFMEFENSSITIDKTDIEQETDDITTVDYDEWRAFAEWARNSNFELVFAVNGEEKTERGIWDPNTALNILTVAHKANISHIVWQLGYECQNQSIEEYLDELETLSVLVETFPAGASGAWKVAAGDVTGCLSRDSKTDFKEYVSLSNDMLDVIFLNGNSSAHQLESMREKDRQNLLQLLSTSTTPLWITENSHDQNAELERAVDWMNSLGFSARNGFSVHFRELRESELYEPSLSFYMALLFKNLVGNRVLDVDIINDVSITDKSSLFAHCTTLRKKPVPGAITFFGTNIDDQPTKYSIKLSKREEGGDIMQFILSQDINGNIIVNGRTMFYEGDIRPVVKRVRPYKTLLINLPPKSFGFWVLANTKVEACHHTANEVMSFNDHTFLEAIPVSDISDKMRFNKHDFTARPKRSEISLQDSNLVSKSIHKKDSLTLREELNKILEKFEKVNDEVKKFHSIIDLEGEIENVKKALELGLETSTLLKEAKRVRRQTLGEQFRSAISKLKSEKLNIHNKNHAKLKETNFPRTKALLSATSQDKKVGKITLKDVSEPNSKFGDLISKIFGLRTRLEGRQEAHKESINDLRKPRSSKIVKRSINENYENNQTILSPKRISNSINNTVAVLKKDNFSKQSNRTKRNESFNKSMKMIVKRKADSSDVNQVNVDEVFKPSLEILLKKINDTINSIPIKFESNNNDINTDYKEIKNNEIVKENSNEVMEDQIVLKSRITDEDASINLSEESNQHGFLKAAFQNIASTMEETKIYFAKILNMMPLFPEN